MSVDLDLASLEYLYGSAVLTAVPYTFSFHAKLTVQDTNQWTLGIGDISSEVNLMGFLVVRNNHASAPSHLWFAINDGTTAVYALGEVTTPGTWFHGAVVSSATNSRICYTNGTPGTPQTSGRYPSGLDQTVIGVIPRNTKTGTYCDGLIAEAAIWNVVLDDNEIAALAKGFSPLLVRPQNLVAYWPLIRSNSSNQWANPITGVELTEVNTPGIAAHPRIIYPERQQLIPTIKVPVDYELAGITGATGSASGPLSVVRVAAGTIGGTGNAIAHLYKQMPLQMPLQSKILAPDYGRWGTGYPHNWPEGQSSVTGIFFETSILSGTVDGQGNLTGHLQWDITLGGITGGSANLTGSLLSSHQLQGLAAAQGNVTAELEFVLTGGLTSATSGISSPSLLKSATLAGSTVATSNCTGTLQADFVMVAKDPDAGYGRFASTYDGWIQAVTSTVATLSVGFGMHVRTDYPVARGNLTGHLSVVWLLEGTLAGTSGCNGTLGTATYTTAIISGAGNLTGTLTRARDFAATSGGTGGATATRLARLLGTGVCAGTGGTNSLILLKATPLAGSVTGNSSTNTRATIDWNLRSKNPHGGYGRYASTWTGWPEAVADVLGNLYIEHYLKQARGLWPPVRGNVSGTLTQAHSLSGNITVAGAITASIIADFNLLGTIAAQGNLSGGVNHGELHWLGGICTGTGDITGGVTYMPRELFLSYMLQRVEVNNLFKQDVFVDSLYEQSIEIKPIFGHDEIQINEDDYERVLVY